MVTGGAALSMSVYLNNALTGTTSETNQAAIRIPGNTLGPNGSVRLNLLWTCTSSANSKTVTLRWTTTAGSVTGGGPVGTSSQTTVGSMNGVLSIRNAGAANSQVGFASVLAPYGTNAGNAITNNVDTTLDTFINVNGTLASAGDTLTLLGYTIEVFHG